MSAVAMPDSVWKGSRADIRPVNVRPFALLMSRAEDLSTLLEERARKRESIGLSPQRPTAKTVVQSPPDAKPAVPLWLIALLIAGLVVAAWRVWDASPLGPGRAEGGKFTPHAEERLIARDDFSDPFFPLPVRADSESELSYMGDLYQVRIKRAGAMAWATLSQPDLGAYRIEADLRLAAQPEYAWGYGGLIARYQNDDNFYLFVVDSEGNYQIQLKQEGAWRTVRAWSQSVTLTEGSHRRISVVDDGAVLHLVLDGIVVDEVREPRLPGGDVGLAVGARSQSKAKGLFDWVALYDVPLAE